MRNGACDVAVQDLARMREDGIDHTVVDVREPDEVEICAIPDSITMPMSDIVNHFRELPRDRPLVVVCHHGIRSMMVTDFLRSSGFDNAWNLAGGIDAWAQQIDPGMARY